MRPSTVCVYAGSSMGSSPAYSGAARALGRRLAEAGTTVVTGGASVGLMGALADAALEAGGRVIGVLPSRLLPLELAHPALSELIEVSSMHERKQTMFELADAFVALPGGLGTAEELTEMATWAQLGLHTKPIVTLDVDGFWRHFHTHLRHAADEGLMDPRLVGLIVDVDHADDVLDALSGIPTPRAAGSMGIEET